MKTNQKVPIDLKEQPIKGNSERALYCAAERLKSLHPFNSGCKCWVSSRDSYWKNQGICKIEKFIY